MAIIREILETAALVLAALFAFWAVWCVTDSAYKLGRAAQAFAEAYKDRTKMIGAQFAETTRAYREVGAAEKNRPQAISFEQQVKEMQRQEVERIQRNARMQQDAAADRAQARHHEHGTSSDPPLRTTLPPVER